MKDGGPAFPVTIEPEPDVFKLLPGMSMRDYFAAKAMEGIVGGFVARTSVEMNYRVIANDAYRIADAMLQAREA